MKEYRNTEYYRELHSSDHEYGSSSSEYIKEVAAIIDFLNPRTILDFGCGKGALVQEIKKLYPQIDVYGFDPAIPGKDILPIEHADLVINTDVLEHIPEDELPSVIETISGLSSNAYFVLHHALAVATLANGQNAHCTVKNKQWYATLLGKYFHHITLLDSDRPWKSAIVTFPLDMATWEKHYMFVRRRYFIWFVNIFFKFRAPLKYKIFQPFMWMLKKMIKIQCR